MNGILLAKWRVVLMLYLLMTAVCVAIDCLFKLEMSFRDVLALVLNNSVLPAIVAIGIVLIKSDHKS